MESNTISIRVERSTVLILSDVKTIKNLSGIFTRHSDTSIGDTHFKLEIGAKLLANYLRVDSDLTLSSEL